MSSSMRAIANINIKFAPLTIETKAYLTASPEEIGLHWLTENESRVKQVLTSEETGEIVERESLSSGYEVEKDVFVSFTHDELALIRGTRSGEVEVIGSVESPDLSPLTVERALYLTPNNSDKTYRLLYYALLASNRGILGKWYDKGKDHIVIIVPTEGLLVLYQLYYSIELRSVLPNFTPASEPTEREIDLARQIVERVAVPPGAINALSDEYATRLRNAIVMKHSGKAITPRNVGKSVDMADAMERMLKRKERAK